MRVRLSEERLKEIEEIERKAQMSFQFSNRSESDGLEDGVGEIVKCYHCGLAVRTELATYFPFGMSDDPFRPLCPGCAGMFEGECGTL